MQISGRFLRGESHKAPFFPPILLSARAGVEKKEAVYAKLLNRPKGQGEAAKSLPDETRTSNAKKGRREKAQRPRLTGKC
jgi:hypothetical protein